MAETLIVACPACNTLNRAPREKLAAGSGGKCGHCGSPLFGGHPVSLDAASFESHAVKSDIPLLVAERMYFQHLFGKALIVLQ